MMKHLRLSIVSAALIIATQCSAADITGAGSTFVSPVMARWIDAYKKATGNTVSYQPVGSSIGVGLIRKAAVDFGASDKPLDPKELEQLGMMQFPIVIGGVVPVVNIEGVKPGQMRFTGEVLADIYLGKIRSWSDPALQAINPDLKLPKGPITVVHRVDGSGTTFNWSNYLSKVSPRWKEAIGQGTTVEWPLGLGGKGNDGVASLVGLIPGSIGYLEYSYALQRLDKISFAAVQNGAGNFVIPDSASFQAAAGSADWTATKDFYLVLTNAPGESAYPITATTFVLMPKQPKSPDKSAATLDFIRWSLESGKPQAELLNYVPLPATLIKQIEEYWQQGFGTGTLTASATGKR